MHTTKLIVSGLLLVVLNLLVACDSNDGNTAGGADIRLSGAGATFPAPLYKRWVTEYDSVVSNVRVDYEAIGSGGGVKSITDKTVHFGASDAPLKTSNIEDMGGADKIAEIPSVAGSVVAIYNLPTVDKATRLRLTGEILSNVYLGKITKWNDPAITAINPGIELPDATITPVYRTDGSGTTHVFTSYLCTQNEDFKRTVGLGKQVQWLVGQGGKGNQGVTAAVQQTNGSLGYVEHSYAKQNHLPNALMKNRSGKFVASSPASVAAAGAGAATSMSGTLLAADIWNQPGDEAYPIAAFTYLIVYNDLHNLPDKEAAQQLVKFFWWATHDGQKYAEELDYAPLAPAVRKKIEEVLKQLTYKGESLAVGQ